MLSCDEILDAWRWQKKSGRFYRLVEPVEVAYEYRGPQGWHSSNYASVVIAARPASDLGLEISAELPASMTAEYQAALARAAGYAAVDELVAADWHPFLGCNLDVREVGWDEEMSSEVALYRAVRGALGKLRREGEWVLAQHVQDIHQP
jgi:hypothetical protein